MAWPTDATASDRRYPRIIRAFATPVAVDSETPLLALTVSMVFEGFHPDALTLTGAGLAVAGNVVMLGRAR